MLGQATYTAKDYVQYQDGSLTHYRAISPPMDAGAHGPPCQTCKKVKLSELARRCNARYEQKDYSDASLCHMLLAPFDRNSNMHNVCVSQLH